MNEWNIAAGILGDIEGFKNRNTGHGFTSRTYQLRVLTTQLGNIWEKALYGYGLFTDGQYKNPLRETKINLECIHILMKY
ncbi:hypothetical protein [Helicobacter saguini]|uniref:hypothetical protein n=1 Tax=Helicobacter saguini TaxID=1548018 RepID=UPI0019255AAB|nr:hypothetical protein [Helicobacter saguini]